MKPTIKKTAQSKGSTSWNVKFPVTQPPAAGKAAHTPTPYTLSVEDHAIEIRCDSHVVADVYIPQDGCAGPRDMKEAKATAAFIVRACNSHAALVANLQGVLDLIEQGQAHTLSEIDAARFRAVLASAK